MRATAKEVPIADEVMDYAMSLTLATQPESECPANISKKYVRCGASPRAAQALISAAKVRALINGRYNVSYNDLNELACPVLRHRIKLTFEAVTDNVTADDVIHGIISELKHTNTTAKPVGESGETSEPADAANEKRGLFGGKKKKNNNG